MPVARYVKLLLGLSLAGVLFSGYLSAVKLLTSTCALSEPCPNFLGYPACWFGFGLFATLFIASCVGFVGQELLKNVVQVHVAVSGLGILFAGYFTAPEVSRLLAGGPRYALGLPTCAYGLLFFVAIFIISIIFLKSNSQNICSCQR